MHKFPVRFVSRIFVRRIHCRFHTMASKHVGIIGAGLSGLRCADILIQNGARVTILEARDRIGGRVCLPCIGTCGAS